MTQSSHEVHPRRFSKLSGTQVLQKKICTVLSAHVHGFSHHNVQVASPYVFDARANAIVKQHHRSADVPLSTSSHPQGFHLGHLYGFWVPTGRDERVHSHSDVLRIHAATAWPCFFHPMTEQLTTAAYSQPTLKHSASASNTELRTGLSTTDSSQEQATRFLSGHLKTLHSYAHFDSSRRLTHQLGSCCRGTGHRCTTW
ncbi:hypothetical protein OH77DRAFT_1013479 [Trametes cingulata]|nr:hypothetical protein OH77DRAFT_1013479 [Trametes cingulata]